MPDTAIRRRPWLIWTLAVVFVLFIAVHFAGIAALRHLAETQLHPALPKGTQIERVELGLLNGLLELSGFELRVDDEPRIQAGTAVVDVDIWRLLTGTIAIERIDLRDVYLRIDRLADGTLDLGLPPFGGADQPAVEKAGPPPDLRLQRLMLEGVRIDYRDGSEQSDLVVDRLDVGNYSLRDSGQVVPVKWRMHWEGKAIDGTADVSMDGDRVTAASGRLRTDVIDLGRVSELARLGQPIAGGVAVDGEFTWEPARATLAGALRAPRLAYRIAERKAELTDLVAPDFTLTAVLAPSVAVTFQPRADVTLAAWDTEIDGHRITGRTLALRGRLGYDGSDVIAVKDGDYRIAVVDWNEGPRRLQIEGIGIAGDIEQSLRGDTPYPALAARIAADAVDYVDQDAALRVSLAGVAMEDLALGQRDAGGHRPLAGKLRVAASEIVQDETVVAWQSLAMGLAGRLGPGTTDVGGDLDVTALSARHPALGEAPLTLAGVRATGLGYSGDARFAGIDVTGLELPSTPPETTLAIGGLQLQTGRFTPGQGVSLDAIVIDGLQTGVIRNDAGEWRYATAGAGAAAPDGPAGATPDVSEAPGVSAPAASGDALAWRIGAVHITGDSRILVADHLNPDMQAPTFHIETFEVGEIDSTRPAQNTPFDMALKPDEYSEFVLRGEMRPLGDLYLAAEGHVHGFDMQSFNGLIANDLGHRFLGGQLDNDFNITIADNRLDMENALGLAQIEAEALPDKEGPPLTTAIALLEDRDGNINLEVPVSGDLSDPDFRVLGALNPIIMKAVVGTAALAIQPLGSVLLVGSLVADQALKVTFDPARFAPGTTEMEADSRDYLAQLAGKLKEKPKLALRICGVAVEVERRRNDKGEFVDQEADLLALADRRAEAAKAVLREAGASDSQLRRCRPAYDATPDALPRVEIRL
jgi:hypothetical protein